jgi:hypothetical protein
VSQPGRQEVLLGVSGDGRTLLYLSGEGCEHDRLMIAHQSAHTFATVDLTPQIDRARFTLAEGCCTLTSDGKTLVLSKRDRTGFVEVQIDDHDQLVVGAELAILPQSAEELAPFSVIHPVVAADRNTIYYRLVQNRGEDYGGADGIYMAERAAGTFRARRIPDARTFGYPSGISSDNLSLFVSISFGTNVLVRSTTKEAFHALDHMMLFTPMLGFRNIPNADCTRVFTTVTPGGCQQEDIAFLITDESVR